MGQRYTNPMSTPASRTLYQSRAWQILRRLRLQIADYRCELCRAVTATEVDHVRPLRQRPDLGLTLSNTRAVCRDCHIARHRPPPSPARAAWDRLLAHGKLLIYA